MMHSAPPALHDNFVEVLHIHCVRIGDCFFGNSPPDLKSCIKHDGQLLHFSSLLLYFSLLVTILKILTYILVTRINVLIYILVTTINIFIYNFPLVLYLVSQSLRVRVAAVVEE